MSADAVLLQDEGGMDFTHTGEKDPALRRPFLLWQGSKIVRIDAADVLVTILLFGTIAMLEKLVSAPRCFMDGTFLTAPEFFAQIFTLHFFKENRLIPALYAILTHKSKDTYIWLFQIIKQLCADNNIIIRTNSSMTDFETGLIPAIHDELQWLTDGCSFHLCQCTGRKVQGLGLMVISFYK